MDWDNVLRLLMVAAIAAPLTLLANMIFKIMALWAIKSVITSFLGWKQK